MFSQECCRDTLQTFHKNVPSAYCVLGPILDAGKIVGNQVAHRLLHGFQGGGETNKVMCDVREEEQMLQGPGGSGVRESHLS